MMRALLAQMVREAHLKFTRELPGTLTIRSVGKDGIRINDRLWSETIALTPQEIIATWMPVPVAELVEDDFAALLASSPELVIVGTGAKGVFPPRELMFAFARRGVGLEVMDTAAAARTFNVLAGEGRRVAAVLYPS
jgi:uncharacterized protein